MRKILQARLQQNVSSMHMNLNKLQETVEVREPCPAAVCTASKIWTQLSDWTTATIVSGNRKCLLMHVFFLGLFLCLHPSPRGPWYWHLHPYLCRLLHCIDHHTDVHVGSQLIYNLVFCFFNTISYLFCIFYKASNKIFFIVAYYLLHLSFKSQELCKQVFNLHWH